MRGARFAPRTAFPPSYPDDAERAFLITVNTYPADKFRFTFWLHRSATPAQR